MYENGRLFVIMFWTTLTVLCYIYTTFIGEASGNEEDSGLLVLTVATEANDGFQRFTRSAQMNDFDLKVLGMGDEWEGGDVQTMPGGGQKILYLRDALEPLKDKHKLIVMFTDSYDLILSSTPEDVMKVFRKMDAKVVFSAEGFCWPDPTLEDKYPSVKLNEVRFLNSGGFIGYAPYLHKMVNLYDIQKQDDDQLYFTKIFLDATLRSDLSMKLDVRSEIFQNLNGALDAVQVKFKGRSSYLYNQQTGTTPLVIHGNGPIKDKFNSLTNYLGDQWTPTHGCLRCDENSISLAGLQFEDYPTVLLAIFFQQPSAFAEEFFNHIGKLNYPKDKISIFIHYNDDFHATDVINFIDQYGLQYASVDVYTPTHALENHQARNKAMDLCARKSSACQYFFSVDGDAQIEDNDIIIELIQRNRSMIGPLLSRPGKSWSNFWGAINSDGYYKRADDYMSILKMEYMGLWNVPYLTTAYLIHGYLAPKLIDGYGDGSMDSDMAICEVMRDQGIFMHLDNQKYYGFLIDNDNFYAIHQYNDLYQIFANPYAWEKKYIHPEYKEMLNPDVKVEEPCPDVYWFPLVTDKFCEHLVGEMENLNEWSGGKNNDPRLPGGYENVPTVDTHTNQIGWEKHWLQILKDYVAPLNNKLYEGYFSDSRATMNFVVRYKPDEQDRLKPHQDSSTFTVNGALNKLDVDYEGGGVRFTRYNCTLTTLRQGWFLMHPGRLTHQHEGLPTTSGTRYIMVSFIDP